MIKKSSTLQARIAWVFVNPQERRLRAGWRLVGWIGLTLVSSVVITLLIQVATGRLTTEPETDQFNLVNQVLAAIGSLLAITLGVFLARRLLDRRSIRSLGLSLRPLGQAIKDLLAGFLIAGIMFFLLYGLMRLAGWTNPVNTAGGFDLAAAASGLGLMLLIYIGVGWQEELFARGYLLQNLEDGLNIWWAVGLSSLVFGLGHLGNPNATLVGALGTGLAGAFLAYAYLRTRQLWLPIGIHIGWNFFEGPVLGFPVSGMNFGYTLMQQAVSGPEWITGGLFGPEAGAIVLLALAAGVGLVWLYTHYAPAPPE